MLSWMHETPTPLPCFGRDDFGRLRRGCPSLSAQTVKFVNFEMGSIRPLGRGTDGSGLAAARGTVGDRMMSMKTVLIVACVTTAAVAEEWHVQGLAGIPSQSPVCCYSEAHAFVPGGHPVGVSGGAQTSIGSYVVAWPDVTMSPLVLDGGPYEVCWVVEANEHGDLAVQVAICPQSDGSCPAVARLVRADGSVEEIGAFGGTQVQVRGLNADGTVVGDVNPPGSVYRCGWIFDAKGARLLPMPANTTLALVNDIGDNGTIVGWAYESGVTGRKPTVWINDAPSYLSTLGGDGEAKAIDENGIIYGHCERDGNDVAVRWVNGAVSELPMPAGGVSSTVAAVSGGGVVAGIYRTAPAADPAIFVVGFDGTLTTLGPLPEDIAFLDLVGVSDGGVVAGTVVYGPQYFSEAFIVGDDVVFQTAYSIAPDVFAQGTTSLAALDGKRMLLRTWGQSSNQGWLVTPASSSGDLNGDGMVNAADLGLLLAQWGVCAGCTGDLNGDGAVDAADLGLLLAGWTSV